MAVVGEVAEEELVDSDSGELREIIRGPGGI